MEGLVLRTKDVSRRSLGRCGFFLLELLAFIGNLSRLLRAKHLKRGLGIPKSLERTSGLPLVTFLVAPGRADTESEANT